MSWNAQIYESEKLCIQNLLSDLSFLQTLQLPRWYGTQFNQVVHLHAFSDASKLGFGAVVYMEFDKPTMFVAAKSKLASTKNLSIPRLELQGLVLSCRLTQTIIKELKYDLKINKITFWINSLVGLKL